MNPVWQNVCIAVVPSCAQISIVRVTWQVYAAKVRSTAGPTTWVFDALQHQKLYYEKKRGDEAIHAVVSWV
jgi:hypothetical protein